MARHIVPADARTWVECDADTDFPIQNLPFGVSEEGEPGEGLLVAIGDHALDLVALHEAGLLEGFISVYDFFDLDVGQLSDLRKRVAELLTEGNDELAGNKKLLKSALIPLENFEMAPPIRPGHYIDFYSGIHHARNVGSMFRPDGDPLLPNYRHVPIGYNGRANTIVASGTPCVRPKGQILPPTGGDPEYLPCRALDFELEMGYYLSHGQDPGKRITCKAAEDHILGLVMVNDWSARDIQRWEYQPLGPFLSKSWCTSVSPWLVTLDALEPFRIEGMEQDPPVQPHLRRQGKQHFDVELEVLLKTPKMSEAESIARSNMKHLYWSLAQQVAHLTSNGTPAEFGDLHATGTISGEESGTFGSMLELAWKGDKPVKLANGEERVYLKDGDEVTLRAWAEGDGFRVGFGECFGVVEPAIGA